MSVAFRELLDTNDPKKAKRSNLKLSNILNRSKDPVEMSGSAKETGNTKKPSLDSFVHCKSLKSTNGQHAKRFDGLSKSFNVAKESPLVTEVSQFKIAQSKQGNKQSNSSCKRKIPSTESEETSEEGFLNVRKKHGKRRMVIEYSDEEDYAPKKIISSSEITVLPHENVKTEEKDSENNDDALESEQSETSISEDSSDPVLEVLKTCEALSKKMRDRLQPLHGTEITKPLSKLITQVNVNEACGQGQELKPYQLVGLNFLMLLFEEKIGGAILADEMGLGKTAQAIVFLALLQSLMGEVGPHLVIAPASLLENWHREINRWCPHFRTIIYHGSERTAIRARLAVPSEDLSFDVMLTCYSLFERDSMLQKIDRKFLRSFNFSCVIMDEAHLLKDSSTMRSKRVREMVKNAKSRLMLTGTPLQNDLQELWSLLELIMPQIFTTRGEDLSRYLGSRQDNENVSKASDLVSRIKGILNPFVLRRVKADVMKQLVPKIQKVNVLEMTSDQSNSYFESVAAYRAHVERKAKGETSDEMVNLPKREIASIFTHLRKVANHPLLVRKKFSDKSLTKLAKQLHKKKAFGSECTEQRVLEEIKEYSDYDIHQLCLTHKGSLLQHKLPSSAVLNSGKCQALADLLPKLKGDGHKALIFSQWTSMLDILEWLLDELGLKFVRLDGSTQVTERQNIVDDFNSSPEIFAFLLSTRAGGQGLNLIAADTVVLHDVDFNPQVDRQAEDRCHRIGQTRPVTVYRLVSKDTVDENILRIAQSKLKLDAAILDTSSGQGVEGEVDTMASILSAVLGIGTQKK